MRGFFRTVVSGTRYFIIIPVIGSLLAAVILTLFGTLAVVRISADTLHKITLAEITPHEVEKAALDFIKLIDIFLLGTVLYIVAIGLYELFIEPGLPLPPWLQIYELDELKEKLIGVVIVLLGVTFLGEVVSWNGGTTIIALGVAVASVIAALAISFAVMPRKHVEHVEAKIDDLEP